MASAANSAASHEAGRIRIDVDNSRRRHGLGHEAARIESRMGRQRGGIVAQRGARSASLKCERTIRHARAGMVCMRGATRRQVACAAKRRQVACARRSALRRMRATRRQTDVIFGTGAALMHWCASKQDASRPPHVSANHSDPHRCRHRLPLRRRRAHQRRRADPVAAGPHAQQLHLCRMWTGVGVRRAQEGRARGRVSGRPHFVRRAA